MEIAAARLSEQIKDRSDIKLIGHSRGGALVMEYAAEVAEGRLAKNDQLRGVYSIDGALSPLNCLINNPFADERFVGGLGPFFKTDRYKNLPQRLKEKTGLNVDLATFDNKADWPFTTHQQIPGINAFEDTVEDTSFWPWQRWGSAHGTLQSAPLIGRMIFQNAYQRVR